MKLGQLLAGIDIINISGDFLGEVSTVCYSADKCEEDSLFVAIPGLKHDGHDFIMDAIAHGAKYIVHEKDFKFPYHVTAIKVADSRRALGILAKNYFANPSAGLALIAVVGTNGKTTITYLLESILQAAGFNCGVLGTVNYRFNGRTYPAPNTTPESYELQRMLREMADGGVTHVIAEVSSHAIDLKRVDDCDFALGIFTNLTRDHLDYHKTMENYFQAKKRFFSEVLPQSEKAYTPKMIINADDQWGQRIISEVTLPALTYGIENDCRLKAVECKLSLAGITAQINFAGETISIVSALIGKFNLYNILAAVGAASILQISPAAIKRGIENLSQVPGRLEKVESNSGFHVFVDYAHTDDALRRVLQNLTNLKKKRIITVFGCGGNRDRGKRPLMGEAAVSYSDLTIITSDNPRLEDPDAIIAEIETGIDQSKIKKIAPDSLTVSNSARHYAVISDRKKAIEAAINIAGAEDIVLIAGKGHEDYQIMGTTRMPFADRLVVEQALQKRSMGNSSPIFTVREVLQATGGALIFGEPVNTFRGITTDSRQVEKGNLFIALKGEKFDGHDFIRVAQELGAAGILVHDETKVNIAKTDKTVTVIRVADTLQALGDLAQDYRKRFSIPVVGLTGSSGKTTTKEMIAAIISRKKNILTTEGNLNNLIGLPLTIFRLTPDHELTVLEMGTNTRGEIKRLTQIAAPDIGLITNVGPAHLAGFGSVDIVGEEKGDLFFHMAPAGTAIVNLDDEAIRIVAARWTGRRITFGMSLDADVTARDIEKSGSRGICFNLVIGDKVNKVKMKIVGLHHVYNALAAAATAWAAGVDCRTIAEGLSAFQPVSGRMQTIKLQNCAYVIDDSYNANPASVREALMTLKDLKNHHNAYVFLGDMLELGASAEEMHRKIGFLMATIGVNAAFLKGDFSAFTAAGAIEGGMPPKNIFLLSDTEDGMQYLKKNLKKGDWVLVKGSRRMKMEKIVAQICDLFGRETNGVKNGTQHH